MAEPANTPPVGEARRPGHGPRATIRSARLPEAPRFAWPDGARIAFTVTLVLDYWELIRPKDASPDPRIVSPLGKFFPDWLTWSQREYGARVGIFRMLDALDQFGITPSVALGAAAAKRYPELVDELVRRNACFMAHGDLRDAPHHQPNERSGGARVHRRKPRRRARRNWRAPHGWCGQDFNEFDRTPALLAEAGFRYTTDWASDDRPFLLGRISVALPPQPEWNDLECMWLRRVTPPVWADNVADAFAYLHDEGGGCFNLTLHPWVSGQAHRIRWLREALSHVLGRGATWRTATDEVARVAREQL